MRVRTLFSSVCALLGRSPSRARLDQAVRLKTDKKPPARGLSQRIAKPKRPQDAAHVRVGQAGHQPKIQNLLVRLNAKARAVIFPFEVAVLSDGRLAR
jgi:hypothetical protein